MPKTWRTCEITQDCEYGYTVDAVNAFLADWPSVKDYAYIVHDKDYKDNGELRSAHIHLMLRFLYPVKTEDIIARARRVGMPEGCITENRIEKTKNWSAALNYLTHRDAGAEKHKYDENEVVSNFEWVDAAAAAHAKKSMCIEPTRRAEIIRLIDSGEMREYTMYKLMSFEEIVTYKPVLDVAFKAYNSREKLKGDRKMEVVFVSGPAGVGKDAFAVNLANRKKYEYYRTGNNDQYPFDDYKGQPCIIWSDARDNIYKPSQLFALLDNHWKSSQKARYSDINLDCKLLIITSIHPIYEWYKAAFEKEEEPRSQLYRRVLTNIEMTDKEVNVYAYDQSVGQYLRVMTTPNIYTFSREWLDTPEKRLAFVRDLLGGMADGAAYMKEHLTEKDMRELGPEDDIEQMIMQNNSGTPFPKAEGSGTSNG